jgi:hypothetical protein
LEEEDLGDFWDCGHVTSTSFSIPILTYMKNPDKKKLASAKKKLREYQHRSSPGVPAGAKIKKKIKKCWLTLRQSLLVTLIPLRMCPRQCCSCTNC